MHLNTPIRVVPREFEVALKISLLLQVVLLLGSGIVMDGGRASAAAIVASAGYWVAVAMIVIRRRTRLTRLDLEIFQWGYPGCLIVACMAAALLSAF